MTKKIFFNDNGRLLVAGAPRTPNNHIFAWKLKKTDPFLFILSTQKHIKVKNSRTKAIGSTFSLFTSVIQGPLAHCKRHYFPLLALLTFWVIAKNSAFSLIHGFFSGKEQPSPHTHSKGKQNPNAAFFKIPVFVS